MHFKLKTGKYDREKGWSLMEKLGLSKNGTKWPKSYPAVKKGDFVLLLPWSLILR